MSGRGMKIGGLTAAWTGVVGLFILLGGPTSSAGELPPPVGATILTIDGAISRTNGSGGARLDRAMIEALGVQELSTSTTFETGIQRFEGVPFAALLDHVGATGAVVEARALDGYVVDIPVDELRRYPVLLALRQNGRTLTVRDKGPIWVVYPMDQHEELRTEEFSAKMIWQLTHLHFR